MKQYSSREILDILFRDGWYIVRIHGSHCQLKHLFKVGIVTVKHPAKSFPPKTLKSIEKQSGLKFLK